MSLLVGLSEPLQAQTDNAPPVDTSPQSGFAWSEVTLVKGEEVMKGYFNVGEYGLVQAIHYCTRNPEVRPYRPPIYTLPLSEVKSMVQRGRYYETLQAMGEIPQALVPRVVKGPVEVFVFADPQVALVKAKHVLAQWYLRRDGKLIGVDKKTFSEQVSAYVKEDTALAQKVSQQQKGYKYADLINIITEYNHYTQVQTQ
ncbi:hypothetical protein BXP70_24435 [Hymenobacter crusticola]|uniref:Uncharacterized protein n=2 Tax=Hymenobacter crusticola TaxID=1770526 RepID=A0A243W7F8_9BACT|nr:hypothetical protein BXP70_24435 [Hymenobacter crusticola]